MLYNSYTPHNQDRSDEWDDSAANAPDLLRAGYRPCEIEEYNRDMGRFLTSRTGTPEEAGVDADYEAWWASREAEGEPTDWPDEPGDEQCASIFEQVEQAQLVKPSGHCVTIDGWDV